MKSEHYRLGIDIGSTTAKLVLLDPDDKILFSEYRRHNAEALITLQAFIQEAVSALGDIQVNLLVTGSAGMGISEKFGIPFIQEVVASAEVIRQLYPEVKTLIDIGGEDAKMIFFAPDGTPDIRMNGSCAGGTGAFIDEMAVLLNIPVSELNGLAEKHTKIYPIASRCGVFAKTDMQNLLSREVPWEDIAASVFHAVVLQILSALSRGLTPSPLILFSGGPLTFLPTLKSAFMRVLNLDQHDVLEAEKPELLPAIGAALANGAEQLELTLNKLTDLLNKPQKHDSFGQKRLLPLFDDHIELKRWEEQRTMKKVERINIKELDGSNCFLGVDSGSTTTKIVLIDEQGRLAFDYYCNNNGNPIKAVKEGLGKIRQTFADNQMNSTISKTMVTGYGEDLIRNAFAFDDGIVETLAHFRAAKSFDENVSFILDIGGQDMKAIFVKNGHIQNIEINEACSSGCGTFIESFSKSMGYEVSDFAQIACESKLPCDLGTRCTVFMNSKVKQAQREGAEVRDISAGLAYSVIKNALHKVLKITNTSILGDNIIVQGGTFRNPAVHKALEELVDKRVLCPDIAELMGAYGAALTARDTYIGVEQFESQFVGLDNLDIVGGYSTKQIRCRGCENNCEVTKLIFENKNLFYTGNRCEKIYTNSGKRDRIGLNLTEIKNELLFDRVTDPISAPVLTLGIPRALGLFENFPFWNTLFVESGIKVRLSDRSTNELSDKGVGTIMSENICFPAKLTHGHIFNLIEAEVDRIFFPMVFNAKSDFSNSMNCYNCPIVTGYPEVIRSAIDPEGKFGIPLDMPAFNFNDQGLLKKACFKYLKKLGISGRTMRRAFAQAILAQREFKEEIVNIGAEVLAKAKTEGRQVILLMTRPYHIDTLINHKVPDILANFGMDVITEDAIPVSSDEALDAGYAATLWEYSNRLFHAAKWARTQDNVEVVQLNSFGCGPDASVVDNIRSMLNEFGKSHTVIRIDEVESIGSTKLRLRSMFELIQQSTKNGKNSTNGKVSKDNYTPTKKIKLYEETDKNKTIIVPRFADFCSPPFASTIMDFGYKVETLAETNYESVEVGLKYTNNEICYPGIVLIGDVIKTLQSGKYDLSEVAIGWWETGGQCRVTTYLPLLKRALISSGFENIPIVSMSTGDKPTHEQPGFKLDFKKFLSKAGLGLIFSDALSQMYHATAIREVNKGEALELSNKYLTSLENGTLHPDKDLILAALENAVEDFNSIECDNYEYPIVGLTGENYLKYSSFGNFRVVDWLMDQGIEVVIPPFLDIFVGWFVSVKAAVRENVIKPDIYWLLSGFGNRFIRSFLDDIDVIMQRFTYYRPSHSIQDVGKIAKEIVELTHRYGEGWMLAGSIGAFMAEGIKDVLCLQPFGCIANHVVAKGVGTRLNEKYEGLNLLFLDIDGGTSEVNFFNRLHFFIDRAKRIDHSQEKIAIHD